MALDSINSGFCFTNRHSFLRPFYAYGIGSGFNYNFKINDDHSFRTGINYSVNREYFKKSKLINPSEDDPLFEIKDSQSDIYSIFDMGFIYSYKDLNIGFAINNIFEPEIEYNDTNYYWSVQGRTTNIFSGYSLKIRNKNELKPSLLIVNRNENFMYYYLFSFKYSYDDKIMIGISYRKTFDRITIPFYCGITLFDRLEINFAFVLYNDHPYYNWFGQSIGGSFRYKIKKNAHCDIIR